MKKGLLLLLPVLALMLTGSAWACHFTECGGMADCEVWSMSAMIHHGEESAFDVHWEIELLENGVTQVYYNSGTIPVSGMQYDYSSVGASGDWGGLELCDNYVARGRIYFTWGTLEECIFEKSFPCDCPNGGGGCGTPGFWKNRPEEWGLPPAGLEIGCAGSMWTSAQLEMIFGWPKSGAIKKGGSDVRVIVLHHLIAAKFNVMHGRNDWIVPYIVAGDDWICLVGFGIGMDGKITGPKPTGDVRTIGLNIKDVLVEYNEDYSDCPEDGATFMPSFSRGTFDDGSNESRSWGAIKEIYK